MHALRHNGRELKRPHLCGRRFFTSLFRRECRSALQLGKHVFDGRDSPGRVALAEIDQQLKAVVILSDDPAVVLQIVIDADDPMSPDRVGETP
jgi:hypothetical protein